MATQAQPQNTFETISARERNLAERIARLAEGGKSDMIELLEKAVSLQERNQASQQNRRVPGRFKGRLEVGPEFFEPLTDEDISGFMGK